MSGRKYIDGFTIDGRKTPIWTKPGNFTNSELTIKPKKKHSSESSKTSTAGRRHAQRPLSASLTRTEPALNGTLDSGLGDSMLRKSVTFEDTNNNTTSSSSLRESLDKALRASSGSRDLGDSGVGSLNGTMASTTDTGEPWFARSLSHHIVDNSISSPSKTGGGAVVEPPLGTIGVALSSTDRSSASSLEQLAREYFPTTLKADTFARSIDAAMPAHLPPSPTDRGLSRSTPRVAWKPKRSRSPTRTGRGRRSYSPAPPVPTGLASQSLEKMYLRSSEAPATGSATVLTVTPYQQELARLRMERLQIEEQHLLEVKRQEELERIRGPQPKWYELKTPDFHYEAHKNNELLRSEAEWQDLLNYRTQLLRSSDKYHHTSTPPHFE